MWILSQDKQTLINTNYLRQFTLGPNRYSIQSAEFINPNERSTLGIYTTPEEVKIVGDMIRDRIQAIEAGDENVKYIFEMPLMISKIFGEVDYDAVWNETSQTWYIKVTVPGEDLDQDSIASIVVVRKAGQLLDAPVVLTPDTDKVLWFGVADTEGRLLVDKDGEYVFKVVRKDGSIYTFSFTYDKEEVKGVELIEADVDYDEE